MRATGAQPDVTQARPQRLDSPPAPGGNGITDAGWAEVWASIQTMSDEEAESVREMVEDLLGESGRWSK